MYKGIIFEGKDMVVATAHVTLIIQQMMDLLGFDNDAQIARTLGVQKRTLDNMRKGTVRLCKCHLEKAADALALSCEQLQETLLAANKRKKMSDATPLQKNRQAFARYFSNAGIVVAEEEEDAILCEGLVLPSLLTKIFASGNNDHASYLAQMYPRISVQIIKDPHFTNPYASSITFGHDLSDDDDLDRDENVENDEEDHADSHEEDDAADLSEEERGLPTQIIDLIITPTVTQKEEIDASTNISQTPTRKAYSSIEEIARDILSAAIDQSRDSVQKTINVATVRSAVRQIMRDHDLHYDPRGNRITLISPDNHDICTACIPDGYVFV